MGKDCTGSTWSLIPNAVFAHEVSEAKNAHEVWNSFPSAHDARSLRKGSLSSRADKYFASFTEYDLEISDYTC